MELIANRALLKQDPSAESLVQLLESHERDLHLEDAALYYNFPLYRDSEDQTNRIQLLLVSRLHGVVIHGCCTESEYQRRHQLIQSDTEQSQSLIFSRLIKSRLLRKDPTTLAVPLVACIYVSGATSEVAQELEAPFFNSYAALKRFYATKAKPLSDDYFREMVSVIEGSKAITKPTDRTVDVSKGKNTKGKIVISIEREIAVFDSEQKRAALNILDGPQRIRGLAGSGKTIILTMKAAQIHLQHPDARILYTFYTKSLYDLIKALITRFYRAFADTDPNWSKIDILHAWGGQALPGVYSTVAASHQIRPLSLNELRQYPNPFDHGCGELLLNDLRPIYDYSILDEGQDFPVNFYRLCEKVTKGRRVIWGYDECQNILNVDLQDPKKTFGKDKNGRLIVDFSNSQDGELCDIVLHVCYRNPRKILVAAFALGFGIYGERIVQVLENNEHWQDLGFNVIRGNSKPGDEMVVERPAQNSPLVQIQLLEESETVRMRVFEDFDHELDYIAQQISEDLKSELLAEDILVVALDDRNARRYFAGITARLSRNKIGCFNLLEAPSNTKLFKVREHVTLSTVYRAKGNEAVSVYVVGVDAVFELKNSVQQRNKLFTAITRAKGWVTLTGIGPDAKVCEAEVAKVMENYPRLSFVMPDKKKIKVYQRDLAEKQERLNQLERQMSAMAKDYGLELDDLVKQIGKPKSKK